MTAITTAYEYDATVVRVIDGDTVILHVKKDFELEVDFGFYMKNSTHSHMSTELNFRLFGIDAPEMSGLTKVAGLAAKAELQRLLGLGRIKAVTYKPDKYGRWLVTLYVTLLDGTVLNVNDEMVKNGFAVTYFLA